MEPAPNFKALSYRLLIFGYQPWDLILIGGGLFLLNLAAGLIYLDAAFLVVTLYVAKKGSRRPDAFFTSFLMYLRTPPASGIDYYKDVQAYRDAWNLKIQTDDKDKTING